MAKAFDEQPSFWDYRQIFRSDLSPDAKLVRLCLAMHADSFEALPSRELVAKECGMSVSRVKGSLRELGKKGWIRYTSTQYILLPPPCSENRGPNKV